MGGKRGISTKTGKTLRGGRKKSDPSMGYHTVDDGEDQPNARGNQQHPHEKNIKARNNRKKNDKYRDRRRDADDDSDDDEDVQLRKMLSDLGLEWVDMKEDGNCLFSALSDQLEGDFGQKHKIVRQLVCDFMVENRSDFEPFLVYEDKDDDDQQDEDARDFEHYIEQMRIDGNWGGHLELEAAARLFRRNIKLYQPTGFAYAIPHGSSNKKVTQDLLVSFHNENHYNSVRNPAYPPKPTRIEDLGCEEADPEITTKSHPSVREDKGGRDPPGFPAQRNERFESSVNDGLQNLHIDNQKTDKKDPCPCGSGKRFGKCCYDRRAARLEKLKEQSSDRQPQTGTLTTDDRKPRDVTPTPKQHQEINI